MSNSEINTDTNIINLVEMKEDPPTNSPDSEELLIKSSNKGKIKENYESKPPLLNKESRTSMSYKININNDNHLTHSSSNKGKEVQNMYSEPSCSAVSDIEGDPDNISITTSIITDNSDTNNLKNSHPSQSLRKKRFSYNSPSTSTSHQWTNSGSSPNINITIQSSTSSNNINNTTNNGSTTNPNNRRQLSNHTLSGSFAELINLTNQALSNNANATNNSIQNSNIDPVPSPSSRRNSISSNIQQNFYRLGLSENINIENLDSSNNEGDNRPSQVGPGESAWLLFRLYAIIKFIWSLIFGSLYFVHFVIKKSKSCDAKIYKFSIVFAIIFALQAISTLLLIIYLPTSITRYTNVIRKKVVISNNAWRITAFTLLSEFAMVIIGAILLFNKDPACSLNKDIAYVTITKIIVIIVVCLYTLILLPFFILPCACTFKLLPEYRGISNKVLKRFNSILYNPSEEVDEEDAPTCSICMEAYKPGTRIKRLPCNHEFHPECITEWLEMNNSCPICRQVFK